MLFKSTESKTSPWQGTKFNVANATLIVLYKNVWNQFDMFYTITGYDDSLYMFWLEDENEKPGEWSNPRDVSN